jgi:Cdc6-like AAA superfamily ATPase
LLTGLIRSLEDERLHTIIYGERGIGKTSLMHVLAAAAREARYLVTYISCGASSGFDETFRSIAAEIPLRFHSDYGPTTAEAEKGQTFADLLPPGPVSVRQASDVAAKLVGSRVLVFLDEFDRVDSAEFRLNIAEFIKTLSDRRVRLQLVIAGVAANLTELVDHIPSIQRSIFAAEVPRMLEEELRQLVALGEEASGLTFEPEAVRSVVAVANGLPYMASLLSHHAGLAALEHGRTSIGLVDVDGAVKEAITELKGRLPKRSQARIAAAVRDNNVKMLGVLAGIAQLNGGRFTVADIGTILSGQAAARCRALVELLSTDGAIIERIEDEFGEAFRFGGDGVGPYLWLLASQSRPAPSDGAVPLRRTAGGEN